MNRYTIRSIGLIALLATLSGFTASCYYYDNDHDRRYGYYSRSWDDRYARWDDRYDRYYDRYYYDRYYDRRYDWRRERYYDNRHADTWRQNRERYSD